MSTDAIASSARSGFVLGLFRGLVLASAFFLVRAGAGRHVQAADARAAPADGTACHRRDHGCPGRQAGSMEAATLALKTRLATQGGPDDQWELLAQSYDFLGRSAEAKLAREHKTSASADLRDAIAASAMLLPAASRLASGASRCAGRSESRPRR